MVQLKDRIRLSREKKDLTRADLGSLISRSEHTIKKYESGEITPPHGVVERIAEVLEVSSSYLLGLDNKKEPNLVLVEKITKETLNEKISWYPIPEPKHTTTIRAKQILEVSESIHKQKEKEGGTVQFKEKPYYSRTDNALYMIFASATGEVELYFTKGRGFPLYCITGGSSELTEALKKLSSLIYGDLAKEIFITQLLEEL